MNDQLDALAERHYRLKVIAALILEEAVDAPGRSMAEVPSHLLRSLRRELDGTPQPTGLATMGS